MSIASGTADGLPSRCPVCGMEIWIPSVGSRHEFCPHCGHLLRFDNGVVEVADPVSRLAELGVFVDVDDDGEVRAIRLVGTRYNDSTIHHLGRLDDVPVIDVSETAITPAGLQRLRSLLPNATIRY